MSIKERYESHKDCATRLSKAGIAKALLCSALSLATLTVVRNRVDADQYFRAHPPAFSSLWNLVVGSGAEYQVHCSYGTECLVDLSIVGQETVDGKSAYWMEISTRHPNSDHEFINKALFYLHGKNIVFPSAITQLPGHPPMTVPSEWMFTWARGELALAAGYIEPYGWGEYGAPSVGGPNDCSLVGLQYQPCYFKALGQFPNGLPKAKYLGPETVTTPAGTFPCQHWQFHADSEPWRPNPNSIDVWLAKGAGPFAIVRARMHDRNREGVAAWDRISEMVLTRVVVDAKDKILTAPQKAQPATLWYWLWEQRNDLLRLCLPQLGLPAGVAAFG